MELKDTVKGMMSDDYKERMAAEYHQTKIRYEKLKKAEHQNGGKSNLHIQRGRASAGWYARTPVA